MIIDGHQHATLGGIAGCGRPGARNIAAVRYPAERALTCCGTRGALAGRRAGYVGASLLPLLARSDEFVGFYFGGRLDEANLARVLAGLPAGRTVELMCHPGGEGMHADDWQYAYWQYAWVAERDALMSPRIRELVAAQGIELVSYRDV
jgi:predicted glycoside hydrolase/deacetylase ChbG (UPF0249 family)